MQSLRTPDPRVADLPCYPFAPHDVDVAFSDKDAITKGGGHFLQEDCGPALAQVIVNFIAATPAGTPS